MGKRYYWLKLPEDFFGDKAIKRLRKKIHELLEASKTRN